MFDPPTSQGTTACILQTRQAHLGPLQRHEQSPAPALGLGVGRAGPVQGTQWVLVASQRLEFLSSDLNPNLIPTHTAKRTLSSGKKCMWWWS